MRVRNIAMGKGTLFELKYHRMGSGWKGVLDYVCFEQNYFIPMI